VVNSMQEAKLAVSDFENFQNGFEQGRGWKSNFANNPPKKTSE
jgi:hypothetical protein